MTLIYYKLYWNDSLLTKLQKLIFFLFADDTNIYYEASELHEFKKVINEEQTFKLMAQG